MQYAIQAKAYGAHDVRQFERYVGRFSDLEDAKRGARYLSNTRNLPLSYYRIVNADDVSDVTVETIEPGEAAYIYGAQMG
jgi:hypothetical protein